MDLEKKDNTQNEETKALSRRDFLKGAVLGAAGFAVGITPSIGQRTLLPTASAANKPVELVFHEVDNHNIMISDFWIKEVERRCQGRVHFTKYVGKELPKGLEVDAFRVSSAAGGKFFLMDLIQMPFLTRNSVDGTRILSQLYEEFEEFRQEFSEFKICGLGTGSTMGLFTSKRVGPIKNPMDLKGMRVRSVLPFDACLAAIGAEPVHVNYPELKQDMINGKMDAAVVGMLPAQVFNLCEEVAPYCILDAERNISTHGMRLAMKWESWHKLPADAQKAIDELGPAGGNCWVAAHWGPEYDRSLAEGALKYVREVGQVSMWDPTDVKDCIRQMQPGIDLRIQIAEDRGLPGRKVYERMLELAKIY